MKEERGLISVIVPVYQVEGYLCECLNSILTQSYRNFELILVDDGSTDAGGILCEAYAKKDSRVRVFHQENLGSSAARNTGIDQARGDYLTFVDPDDVLLTPEYLRLLAEGIRNSGGELCVCLYRVFRDPEKPPYFKDQEEASLRKGETVCAVKVVSGREFCAQSSSIKEFPFAAIWGKLYERSLFDKIRYPVGRMIEDNAVAHRLFFPCEKVTLLDVPMYGYRTRSGSIMKATPKAILEEDIRAAFSDRVSYYREQGCPDLAALAEEELQYHLALLEKRGRRTEVSIIVPVYNMAAYLDAAVESVRKQTFTNWEMILIDDGSTDGSGRLCKAWAEKDGRIRVIRKENAGVSAARNAGLDACKGEYIVFLDPDDVWLDRDYLQSMLEPVKKDGAGMSVCGITFFRDGEAVPEPLHHATEPCLIAGRSYLLEKFPGKAYRGFAVGTLNTMLFPRDAFETLRFPCGFLAEDNALLHHLLYPVEKVALVGRQMYGYRKREDAQTRSENALALYKGSLRAYRDRLSYFREKNDEELVKKTEEVMNGMLAKLFLSVLRHGAVDQIPEKDRPDGDALIRLLEGFETVDNPRPEPYH